LLGVFILVITACIADAITFSVDGLTGPGVGVFDLEKGNVDKKCRL